MQLIRLIIVWLLVGGLGLAADAELRFARIFTDHAVLQRDRPVPIWGWASPAAEVTVSFAGQQQAAIADASGRWQVQLAPLAASAEPRTLSVSGSGETVALEDILVGDVWLAGGQSNMGFSISKSTHADEARKVIPHLHLRRFKVGPWLAHRPLADLGAEGAIQDPKWRMGDDGQWRAVANDRFGLDWISAVAAWFAHEVHAGFYRIAEEIYNLISSELESDYEIILTGHSMGGSIALLLSMHLQKANYPLKQVVTFGQFRVTNRAGTMKWRDLPYIRVAAEKDYVTWLPPTWLTGYHHFGKNLKLIGDTQYRFLVPGEANMLDNLAGSHPRVIQDTWERVHEAANQKMKTGLPDMKSVWGPGHDLDNYIRKLAVIAAGFPKPELVLNSQ